MDFDYVIVGGGSAGCVLANRLSQNPDHSVLLIERGGRDTSPWIHIPATFFKVIGKGRDVHFYTSDADEGLGGRSTIDGRRRGRPPGVGMASGRTGRDGACVAPDALPDARGTPGCASAAATPPDAQAMESRGTSAALYAPRRESG